MSDSYWIWRIQGSFYLFWSLNYCSLLPNTLESTKNATPAKIAPATAGFLATFPSGVKTFSLTTFAAATVLSATFVKRAFALLANVLFSRPGKSGWIVFGLTILPLTFPNKSLTVFATFLKKVAILSITIWPKSFVFAVADLIKASAFGAFVAIVSATFLETFLVAVAAAG